MIPNVPESTVPGVYGFVIPAITAFQIEWLARILCVCDGEHPDQPLDENERDWLPRHLENHATINEAEQRPVRWHNYIRSAYRALVTDAVMHLCKPSPVE